MPTCLTQTVLTLIKRRNEIGRRLILVYTACLCPLYGTLRLIIH